MTNPTFSWLHLTDFHFGLKGQDTRWPNLREPFLKDLAVLHKSTGPWQAVLFTGDLVQEGRSEEFMGMQKEVLERLWSKLDELGSRDAVLLAVPGNHDLFRPNPNQEDNPAVDKLLEKDGFAAVAAKFWGNPAGAYRRVVHDAFAAYTDWWKAAPRRPAKITHGSLPGDFSCTLKCGDYPIGIVGLNTAFFQLAGGDYHGKLMWDVSQLHAVCGNAADDWLGKHSVCLLLTHQGPDWLTDEARIHGETEIAPAGRFALHLHGHMHTAEIQHVRRGGSPQAVRFCQGQSAFGMEKRGDPPVEERSHGYTVGRIEFKGEHASLRLWPRIATDKPRGDGWRYVPDSINIHLEADGGTLSELFPCRRFTADADQQSSAENGAPRPRGGPVVAHSTLPSRRPFFGREKELEDIAKFLRPEHKGWGVVLGGPGGQGKTSLALEAAHLAPAELYPLKLFITAKSSRLDADGVHAVEDHRVEDFFGMLTEIGSALGHDEIDRVPQDRLAERVLRALAGQRVLLVLDNLETFSQDQRRRTFHLLDVLPAGCRAIVTTRSRDETAARTLKLDKLDFYAAKQLLDKLGERIDAVARLTGAEYQTLYAETGGNPLLLTWTAAQLGRSRGRSRTIAAAVARLREAHLQQKSDGKNDPLEFVFGDLLGTFTKNETAMLVALSLFDEPARLERLLAVAQLNDVAARAVLDDVRDRALLIEDEISGTWFLPPLFSQFLRHRRRGAFELAGKRLAGLAYELALKWGGHRQDGYPDLEAAWPTIQAALPLLIAGKNARLQQVCESLEKFLDFTGRWHRLLVLSQAAETKAQAAGDYTNAGWRAYDAGCVHFLQGDADAVFACAERCMDHWGNPGAGRQRAVIRYLRGNGHHLKKNAPMAIAAIQDGLDHARLEDPQSGIVCTLLNTLAGLKAESKDTDGAEADYRDALEIATAINADSESTAAIMINLAEMQLIRRNWAAAQQLALQAQNTVAVVGRLELIAETERILAEALVHQGQPQEALPHARKAVEIYTPLRSSTLETAAATLATCQAACAAAGGGA